MRVTVAEYPELQKELSKNMHSAANGEWNPHGVRWQRVFSYDEGGGGYSNLVPLVLVQREGERLTGELREREAPLREVLDAAGWTWEVRDLRVQLYDLGVGVIVGTYEVVAPAGQPPAEVARQVREWSNLTRDEDGRVTLNLGAAYEEIAKDSVERFRCEVERCKHGELLPPWLTLHQSTRVGEERNEHEEEGSSGGSGRRVRTEREVEEGDRGRLKWLHPVLVLPPPNDSGSSDEAAARESAAAFSRSVRFEHGIFAPGVKRSVVALNHAGRGWIDGPTDDQLLGPSTPVGLILLNWAYYALFMDIDRGLLAALDKIGRHDKDATLNDLEGQAEEAYGYYVRVREARARLDSALNGLGPGQITLWEELADVTRFEQLEGSVERKLTTLRTIAESRVQEAAAASTHRNRLILTFLTALTIVTVAVALLGHFLGGPAERIGPVGVQIAIVGLAFLAAVGLFLLAAPTWFGRWTGWSGGRDRRRAGP